MTQEWRLHAACRGQDVELFFPFKQTSAQAARAKAFCKACPVTAQCLKLAIDTNTADGIFGGMNATERSLWSSGSYQPDYSVIGHRDKPGTLAGYYREKTSGILPCDECRDAFNAYSRAQQRRYREAAKCM